MNQVEMPVSALVLSGVGLIAGIGGVVYANKKGYNLPAKIGMFVLFAAPFNIASGLIIRSAVNKQKMFEQGQQTLATMRANVYSQYNEY